MTIFHAFMLETSTDTISSVVPVNEVNSTDTSDTSDPVSLPRNATRLTVSFLHPKVEAVSPFQL